MLRELLATGCFIAAALAMIAIDQGFQVDEKKWLGLVNQPRTKVQEEILKDYPNVEFRIFSPMEPNRILEEFFFGKVRLVVDDKDIVVEPPFFYGQKPDLTFISNLLGKQWKIVKDTVIKELPTVTVVVEQNGSTIYTHDGQRADYLLIVADSEGIVKEMPVYVRVLPKTTS